jgi:hypothetical protein
MVNVPLLAAAAAGAEARKAALHARSAPHHPPVASLVALFVSMPRSNTTVRPPHVPQTAPRLGCSFCLTKSIAAMAGASQTAKLLHRRENFHLRDRGASIAVPRPNA